MAKNEREMFDVEKIVFNELLSCGYPKESIIMEGKLDSRRFADFVIIDVHTKLPMMIIEVKTCGERTQKSVKKLAFESLKRCYDNDKNPVKAVAVIVNRFEQKLEIIDFTEAVKENDYDRAIEDYILPPYDILTIGARQKAIQKKEDRQRKSINTLKLLCWCILPVVCVILLILDALEVYTFSILRLCVVGVGVGAALTLVPCFKEIKIGEISLINEIEKQKEEEK